MHHDACARGGSETHIAVRPDRLLGIPAEELGRVGRLAHRVRPRLAVLERDQAGELVPAGGEELEALAQHLGPLTGRAGAPVFERGVGGVERGNRVLDGAGSDGRKHRLVRRVQHLEGAAVGRVAPGPADIKLCFHRDSLEEMAHRILDPLREVIKERRRCGEVHHGLIEVEY